MDIIDADVIGLMIFLLSSFSFNNLFDVINVNILVFNIKILVLRVNPLICCVSVCDVGTFRDKGNVCALCPHGTHKDTPSDGPCSPCEDGTVTVQEGSVHCGK